MTYTVSVDGQFGLNT